MFVTRKTHETVVADLRSQIDDAKALADSRGALLEGFNDEAHSLRRQVSGIAVQRDAAVLDRDAARDAAAAVKAELADVRRAHRSDVADRNEARALAREAAEAEQAARAERDQLKVDLRAALDAEVRRTQEAEAIAAERDQLKVALAESEDKRARSAEHYGHIGTHNTKLRVQREREQKQLLGIADRVRQRGILSGPDRVLLRKIATDPS